MSWKHIKFYREKKNFLGKRARHQNCWEIVNRWMFAKRKKIHAKKGKTVCRQTCRQNIFYCSFKQLRLVNS